MTDLTRIAKCPPKIGEAHVPTSVEYWPETGGLVFRTAEIPPHSGITAMHASDTLDLMVVISGEIWAYQEHSEEAKLLKPGDTLIQCGTSHAWENKGDEPCLYAVVLVGARKG
jgi:quercetin dioxygenase-like cupin family protein